MTLDYFKRLNQTYVALTISTIYIGYFFWNSLFAKRIKVNDGCGWDGSQYCEMFYGQLVMEPYSRRILAPKLVSLLFDEPINGFFIVNNILIILTIILIYLVIKFNVPIKSFWISSLVVIATLGIYIFSRHALHLNFVYPVLTEHLYFFLIIMTFFLLFAINRGRFTKSKIFLAVPLAFTVLLSGITRESLGPIFLIFSFWLLKNRLLLSSSAIFLGSLSAIYLAFTQPTNSKAAPLLEIVIHWLRMNLSTTEGIIRFTAMFLLAAGPFIFLINQRTIRLMKTEERALLTFVVIFTAASALGGGDTDRILFPIGLLLTVLFARLVLRHNIFEKSFIALALAFYFWQLPFKVIGGTGEEILEFYGLRLTALSNVLDNAVSPIIMTFPLILIAIFFYRYDTKRLTSTNHS